MDSNQESVYVSQISTRKVQSMPTLRSVSPTRSHPTASISHQLDQPPADTRNIFSWIQGLPREFRDVDEGLIKDMMMLALRYFKEIEQAARNNQGATSELEVFEQRKRLSLWTDGNSDLDRRLRENPAVRELVVSNLTALVLLLSTGSTHCSTLK